MENILELKNVSYVYGKGTPFEKVALDNVSVSFGKGRITGLIGHTGSGKSTLVSLLNGLLAPSEGEVLLNGENIWDKPKDIAKVRFRVGLVMQYPEYQLFDDTVRSDIGFGPRNKGLDKEEIDELVMRAAGFAGVSEELLDKAPFELSGGQKRRVAIAGVIAMQPEVLVLDEPAAGLDPKGRIDILSGIRTYVASSGSSAILVSHSMEDMAYFCDDVVIMNKGRIADFGTADEIFSHAGKLSSLGLDSPSVSKISDALIARGIALSGRLYTVEGVRDAVLDYIRRSAK